MIETSREEMKQQKQEGDDSAQEEMNTNEVRAKVDQFFERSKTMYTQVMKNKVRKGVIKFDEQPKIPGD